MNYRSLPIFITVSLTFIGISLSNHNRSALSQISPNFPITLIAQSSNTTTTLQLGDQGERVKLLQNTLKSLGYLRGKINGVFDEDTKKAVSEFQRKQGLRVNGIANSNLQELLQRNLFDQYMNLAYTAAENKDYQLAKKQFEQALKISPNNIYAEKAIANINIYLEKSAEELKKKQEQERQKKIQENIWWIVLGSCIFLVFILGMITRLRKSNNSNNNEKEESSLQINENINTEKSDLIRTDTEILDQDDSSLNNSSLSLNKDTKHLKKVDGIEELIKDLKLVHGATRRKAIWELAQRADSRAMQPLVQLMIEADSQERSLILEAISQISTRTLKPLNRALAVSLQDENAQVRLNAIRDLTRIYELIAEVNQRLYHATDDEDQEVRETATWALKNLTKMQLPYHQDHQDGEN